MGNTTPACTFDGTFLSVKQLGWDANDPPGGLPQPVRVILYLLGLGWTFLGIGVISDIFMCAIEKVTSLKKRVKGQDGKERTVLVWNATIANLTLMALGSSAPEILLSMIEISIGEMMLGDLGAGTIVGSAAFNLLMISAVCVCAIPEGEIRFIKETHVYLVTSSFSVFAYLWLLVILQFSSPDVCEVWEAALTLIFMPILLVLAYLADRGYFSSKSSDSYEEQDDVGTIPEDVSDEELRHIEKKIRERCGQDLTNEQVVQKMHELYFHKRSRAYYRHEAQKKYMNRQKEKGGKDDVVPVTDSSDAVAEEKKAKKMEFNFKSQRYSIRESDGEVQIHVFREGPEGTSLPKAEVKYATVEGTAKKGEDFEAVEGTLTFEKDEVEKIIHVPIKDDDKYEENEEFGVQLSEPAILETAEDLKAVLGKRNLCTIVIIDDDPKQLIKFENEKVNVSEKADPFQLDINVYRMGGTAGKATIKYHLESMGAVSGYDYEGEGGTLEFEDRMASATLQVTILPSSRIKEAAFNVVLSEVEGACFDESTDGGEESCICHVKILPRVAHGKTTIVNRMKSRVASANAIVGRKNWGQQFVDAIFKVVDDDDEEEEDAEPPTPGPLDYFFHILNVPWKLLFAFVPPTDFCGGWACFFGALVMIAVVTAIVGDMANLVGSCLDINPEITAITFVALGTSLPDTFASMTAAQMDPYADASIGNVTGSNSVNVFLGIGISWLMGAAWWVAVPQTDDTQSAGAPIWYQKLMGYECSVVENIGKALGDSGDKLIFMTPAGTMWLNLLVFSLNALCAIFHLYSRRKAYGGELGGPRKAQYFSAAFLGFQWFIYIVVSSIIVVMKDTPVPCAADTCTKFAPNGGTKATVCLQGLIKASQLPSN